MLWERGPGKLDDKGKGYRVLRPDVPDWCREFYCLQLLPSHPLGNRAKVVKFLEVIEFLKKNDDLDIHVSFVEIALDFIVESYRLCVCLQDDLVSKLLEGCFDLISWVKTFSIGDCARIYKKFGAWLKDIPENVEEKELVNKLFDQKEYIEELIGVFYRSKGYCDFSDYQAEECDECLPSMFHCITEHKVLSELRKAASDNDFFKVLERVGQDEYLDEIPVMNLVLDRFSSGWLGLMRQLVERLEEKIEREMNYEFKLAMKLMTSMEVVLKDNRSHHPQVELIFYRVLAKLVVEGCDVLSNFLSSSHACGRFFEFFEAAEVYDSIRQMSYFIDNFSHDVRRSLCFGLWIKHFRKTNDADLERDGGYLSQLTVDDRTHCFSGCMIYVLEKNREKMLNTIHQYMEGGKLSVGDQSALLWFGYESGVLSRDDYQELLSKFNKESREHYFHSLLAASDPEETVFLKLQTPDTLELDESKCEALALKAFELGRIQDTRWLVENRKLSHIEALLAWRHGVSLITETTLLPLLLDAARNGKNQAQCRSIDWILAQKKLSIEGGELFEAQSCSYLHLSSIWTDAQRLLYQGIALSMGLGCCADEATGRKKINAALASDNPIVPFLLLCHQSSGRVKLMSEKIDLLVDFADKMPLPCDKVMAEILLIVGLDECRNGVAELERLLQTDDSLRKRLTPVVENLSTWLLCWSERHREQKMTPLEKLVYQLEQEKSGNQTIDNFVQLKSNIGLMSHRSFNSEDAQDSLILAVQHLHLVLTDERRQLAKELFRKINREHHPALLKGEANIMRSIANHITGQGIPPFQVKAQLADAGLGLIEDIVMAKERALENEWEQMTPQKRAHVMQDKIEKIEAITDKRTECKNMTEALQLILYAHKFEINYREIEVLRTRLMPRVLQVLGNAMVHSSDEALVAAGICLRVY